jgi:hypothetical protein
MRLTNAKREDGVFRNCWPSNPQSTLRTKWFRWYPSPTQECIVAAFVEGFLAANEPRTPPDVLERPLIYSWNREVTTKSKSCATHLEEMDIHQHKKCKPSKGSSKVTAEELKI